MKEQARRVGRHTEWPFVADEVYFMPAARQFHAQRRRQNSAAANRWVASDTDFQRAKSHESDASG
jgi:hypothetical protein